MVIPCAIMFKRDRVTLIEPQKQKCDFWIPLTGFNTI